MYKTLNNFYLNDKDIPKDMETIIFYSNNVMTYSVVYDTKTKEFVTSEKDILIMPIGTANTLLKEPEPKLQFEALWDKFTKDNGNCNAILKLAREVFYRKTFYIFTSKGIKRKEIFIQSKYGHSDTNKSKFYDSSKINRYKYFYCEDCKEYIDISNLEKLTGYNSSLPLLCKSCYDKQFYTCSSCNGSFNKLNTKHKLFDGEILCPNCYSRQITSCYCCNTPIRKDKAYRTDDGYLCKVCHDTKYSVCDRCKISVQKDRINYYAHTNQSLCNRCRDFYDKARDIVVISDKHEECLTKLSYGIELETSSGDVDRLYNESNINYLFKPMSDNSITGTEWVSPILKGDDGFEFIKSFLGSLKKTTTVDSNCGYHVHFGVTFNSLSTLYKVLYGFRTLQDYFFNLVPASRLEPNKRTGKCYCAKLPHNLEKFGEDNLNKLLYDTADKISAQQDKMNKYGNLKKGRYYWLNLHSYFYRRTLEIRNHEGTLDYDDITNWINLNGRVIEYFTNTGFISMTKRLKTIHSMEAFFDFVEEITNKHIRNFYEIKYNILYNNDTTSPIKYKYYHTPERIVNISSSYINKELIYKHFNNVEQLIFKERCSDEEARAIRRIMEGRLISRNYSQPTLEQWANNKPIKVTSIPVEPCEGYSGVGSWQRLVEDTMPELLSPRVRVYGNSVYTPLPTPPTLEEVAQSTQFSEAVEQQQSEACRDSSLQFGLAEYRSQLQGQSNEYYSYSAFANGRRTENNR